ASLVLLALRFLMRLQLGFLFGLLLGLRLRFLLRLLLALFVGHALRGLGAVALSRIVLALRRHLSRFFRGVVFLALRGETARGNPRDIASRLTAGDPLGYMVRLALVR